MYIFLLIVFSFFACIGLIRFIDAVLGSAYRDFSPSVLVLKSLSADNVEMRVRRAVSACESLRCEHLQCECLDEESAKICEKLGEKHPIIEVVLPIDDTDKREK